MNIIYNKTQLEVELWMGVIVLHSLWLFFSIYLVIAEKLIVL